ncbi:unnamed protein product, partial [Ostreobium quekettii]
MGPALACLLLAAAALAADDLAGPEVPMGGIGTSGARRGNGTKQAATVGEIVGEKVEDAIKEEFRGEVAEAERDKGKNFNQTANKSDVRGEWVEYAAIWAQLETVIKVPGHKPKVSNDSIEVSADGNLRPVGNGSGTNATDATDVEENDVDRIIDKQDNEYVLSTPKHFAALTLDPRLIKDLTILITTAAAIGMVFEAIGQPVINGYLIAGAIVGPGGLMLIKELVQVESLSQLGVQFLLFYLGMEFSVFKMRVVGGVALMGGLIEASIFVGGAALLAAIFGGVMAQGIFLGALISMSSTSVVVKVLEASHSTATQYGQITIGTLILQDCTVGVMFAMLPILSGKYGGDEVETTMAIATVLTKLAFSVTMAVVIARTMLPYMVRILV